MPAGVSDYLSFISVTVLYDTPGNAGSGHYVHTFPSYLWGAQFTLRTDHSSLRWLQKFRNSDGMLARWYMLLVQLSTVRGLNM